MNLLPLNCQAVYDPDFLSSEVASALLAEMTTNYDMTCKVIQMADGSEFESGIGVFMFADENLLSFDKLPEAWGSRAAWPDSLFDVKDRIESTTGERFQVAGCVYYRDGSEGMEFHVDEPAYGPTDAIVSISLGAEREFVFRSLSNPTDRYSIKLAHGSLLYMGEHCQERYQHGLPPSEEINAPRLNLTFRKFGWDE